MVFRSMSVLPRSILLGALSIGVAGAIAGLLVGLATYPPTAAFAVIELGIPATIVGALIGLLIGSLVFMVRRIRRRAVR